MLIRDIFKNKNKLIKSFELFPPKEDYDYEKLFKTVKELKNLEPDFVSITYGAGGSTRNRTVDIASKIKNEIGIETVAHFTCVNTNKEQISSILDELKAKNIHNILALRGDPPKGQENFTKTIGGFEYASDLVSFIKAHNDWSISVAGYPEGHQDAESLKSDIEHLKIKVDNGADLIISQMFFDNTYFYKYCDLAAKAGISIPIVPGIFPILNYKAIKRIASLCGATIPKTLQDSLEKVKDSKADTRKVGIEHAIKQSEDLIDNGVPGLHFYSMNKSGQMKKIFDALKHKF